MPVLVDTSVWRRYLSGGAAVRRLGKLLDEEGLVLTHPWVIAELVLGGLSEKEERLFERLPSAAAVPHDEVLLLVRHRRLARRGIGWVDANLIASAIVSSAALWTLDADLARVASNLRVDFEP